MLGITGKGNADKNKKADPGTYSQKLIPGIRVLWHIANDNSIIPSFSYTKQQSKSVTKLQLMTQKAVKHSPEQIDNREYKTAISFHQLPLVLSSQTKNGNASLENCCNKHNSIWQKSLIERKISYMGLSIFLLITLADISCFISSTKYASDFLVHIIRRRKVDY